MRFALEIVIVWQPSEGWMGFGFLSVDQLHFKLFRNIELVFPPVFRNINELIYIGGVIIKFRNQMFDKFSLTRVFIMHDLILTM